MTISLRWLASVWSNVRKAQASKTPGRSRFCQDAAVLISGLLLCQVSWAQNTGINFPPNQGTSGGGAFLPGIYTYTYTNAEIAAANSTFNMMRIPINEATANDPASLQTIKGYIDQLFGVAQPGKTHGDGFPDGLAAMGAAWANINAVFSSYPNVHYEIFNEPFAYQWSTLAEKQHYVSDMETIITDAGMSINNPKIILDGMGFAQKVDEVVEGGWTGDIGYHFYPNWIDPNNQTPSQSNFSNLVQGALGTYGQRVWITEFGANLSELNTCYDTYDGGTSAADQNINALRGLDDALRALKANGHGVKGAFAWHGWDNGDSYDYWLSSNSNGACKIREIETHD
jgi:hypothetical protein